MLVNIQNRTFEALNAPFGVHLLNKAVVFQQQVRWVLEGWNVVGTGAEDGRIFNGFQSRFYRIHQWCSQKTENE